MILEFFLGGVALIAGAVALISGFGIGSLLTPLLTLKVDAKLAVTAVSIPHFLATLIRFLKLRSYIKFGVRYLFRRCQVQVHTSS